MPIALFLVFALLALGTIAAAPGDDTPAPVSAPVSDAKKGGTRLVVKIENLRNNKGAVAINLFRGAEGFPDDDKKAYAKHVAALSDASNKTATVTFSDLPPGEWAVVLLHDENKNGKMDTGWFGIPKEGFGASNNPKARSGPPRFKDAQFTIAQGETERTITIKPIYMGKL